MKAGEFAQLLLRLMENIRSIIALRCLHQFNDELRLSVLVKGCGNGTPRSGLHALDELREAGELLGHGSALLERLVRVGGFSDGL